MTRARLLVPPVLALASLLAGCMPPSWGAAALLHPGRHPNVVPRPANAQDVEYDVGIKLEGWRFAAARARRGTVIFLHGLSANRAGGIPIADHFTAQGFDVIAYDGRAHGDSGGEACTYGFYEKLDLKQVIDRLTPGPVIVFGWSLGAGIALQEAADDDRVGLVVAVAPISDLRTAAAERAPFFASRGNVDEALRLAEQEGRFRVDEVSPMQAAARVRAAVLLIHGAADHETPPAHSERVYAHLAGPKKLMLVPAAGHNDVMTPQAWREVDEFVAAHGPS
jgi:pimeloyl-ACP methyl ester carboxylesterase